MGNITLAKAESTDSVRINGADITDTNAIIIKITESSGSYLVAKDGIALTPVSGECTVSGGVKFSIVNGQMIVAGYGFTAFTNGRCTSFECS
jgi:hypothetical protein